MKIVVIGGSGLIGRDFVSGLVAEGHDPVPASPATGVDTITGGGLADVVVGADVVVDVSNAPVWDDDAVMKFFTTWSRNLLAAERDAGVGHHTSAVSIVGADRLPDSGYLRAKVAHEAEIEAGSIPYTILRATQFFEFLPDRRGRWRGRQCPAVDRADSVRRRRRGRGDGGRARDRRAGRRPRRAGRAPGAGHRRLGAAAVCGHRR